MKISDAIWSNRLDEGGTLGERVLKKAPTVKMFEEDSRVSLLAVWKNRLDDAVAAKNHLLEKSPGDFKFHGGKSRP